MTLPKFSFSLPVYNEEARLGQCLQSIAAQDYPQDAVEVLVVDGGSSDKTKDIAQRYPFVRLFDNPRKLADYGAKISIAAATGGLFVIFAADNELCGGQWLKTVAGAFTANPAISCLWMPQAAAPGDPALNHYYELIQNDPLSYFVNQNLRRYIRHTPAVSVGNDPAYIFTVLPERPLIWGANGLVYRTQLIRGIILQEGFIADNDVFQTLIESGKSTVAYLPKLYIYHHHLRRLGDWVRKWRRNYRDHFLAKVDERNLRWAFDKNFSFKLALWICYSGIPVFSILHSLWKAMRSCNIYWMYHPVTNFLQMITYSWLTISTAAGRALIKKGLVRR